MSLQRRHGLRGADSSHEYGSRSDYVARERQMHELAQNCYKMADAMLKARERELQAAMRGMPLSGGGLNEDCGESC